MARVVLFGATGYTGRLTAEALVAAGVARCLLPAQVSPESVRTSLRALLEDRAYRDRAHQLAREMEEMPGPERGVELVERLARERRPLTHPALQR